MNNKFDELTRGLAQSVTRRAALRKFGVGLAGMTLACLGIGNKAEAATKPCVTACKSMCAGRYPIGSSGYNYCERVCVIERCQW